MYNQSNRFKKSQTARNRELIQKKKKIQKVIDKNVRWWAPGYPVVHIRVNLNKKDENAGQFIYGNIPKNYLFNLKTKKWITAEL